jgi:hypothetical protein
VASVIPLRNLSIACFSTKLALLDRVMLSVGQNTYVKQLQKWRDDGFSAYAFYQLVRGEGDELRPQTAEQVIECLVQGSPALRLIMDHILQAKIVEPLNPEGRTHQKLLAGNSIPLCAWMIDIVLQLLLVDARVFHSQLTNHVRPKWSGSSKTQKAHLRYLS